ncbi:MAG: 2,4'-dihydroxyacetophenone dioxygenase family protein, partial [Acinetobacter sp.]
QSVKHQDRLLTINIKDGEIKNALPGVHVTPCFLDPDNGVWVIHARFEPGTILPRHFHTGVVHFYTTAGSWHYVEYPEDVQTAGSYLFEPAGSIHTLATPEGAEGFMV